MQIALTKKLSDAMGLKPDSSAQEVDALFRWTANWTNTFDGRKEDLLVLVNQATRFVVTIYGVKRAQLKQVEQRIATAISNTLHAMNLNPQIIDAYLDCGRNIQFVANRDRKAASHVSKQGLDAAFVLGRAVNESGGAIKYDDTMGHIVSNRPVNYSGGFESVIYPDKEMIHQLSAYFKMPAFRYDALELQVILDLEIYQAVRRIIVPANIELCQLHQVIQKVFGWKDYHSYDFAVLDCKNEKPPLLLVPDDTYLELDKDAALVQGRKLSEFISKDNFLVYTYDLGDNWEHKIELVREILDHDQQSPYLLEAKGKTPPEDVGGVGGFLEFRKIMIQPRHPEYEHMKQWAGYWDPELSDWESRPRVLTYE